MAYCVLPFEFWIFRFTC